MEHFDDKTQVAQAHPTFDFSRLEAEHSVHAETLQSIWSASQPQHGDGALAPKAVAPTVCPTFPDYVAYIDTAARNIYDPRELGDINALKHKFDCGVHSTENVFKDADMALATTGDRFNMTMPPTVASNFRQKQAGGYSGIGLEIDPVPAADLAKGAPGLSEVKRPMPGKPAEAAGLLPGDVITAVDGADVRKMMPAEISGHITNGAPGSSVDIVIDRQGQRVEKHITRQAVDLSVVHDRDLGNGVVYIGVDSFESGHTANDIAAAMDAHRNARSFVLDLRGNGGGLVDQALQSAELFVPSGNLMHSKERVDSSPANPVYAYKDFNLYSDHLQTDVRQTNGVAVGPYSDQRQPYKAAGRPVVLLTDADTASAAEIFTGALHDSAHDTVFGTTTFGKGIGQNVIKNQPDGGWLKVTALHYVTPSGKWPGDAHMHRIGLAPDVSVLNPQGAVRFSADDVQLSTAVNFLKGRTQN